MTQKSEFKRKKNKNRLQGENTHFLHQAKNESIRTIKTLLITHRRTPRLRETETTTYTHRRTRGYTKVIERVLLTKAHFTGSVQLLFNLPRSLKMSIPCLVSIAPLHVRTHGFKISTWQEKYTTSNTRASCGQH